MNEYLVSLVDGVQTLLTIAVAGVTLFKTVAQPLKRNMQHQMDMTKELQATNKSLCELIKENRNEHEVFRMMLSDHEKRIYKMED